MSQIQEVRRLAEAIAANPADVAELVVVDDAWRGVARGSDEAKALLPRYQTPAFALGRVFASGLAMHSNDLVAEARKQPGFGVHGVGPDDALIAFYTHLMNASYAMEQTFVKRIEASPLWLPAWNKWRQLVEIEGSLDDRMFTDSFTAQMHIGVEAAVGFSTQVLERITNEAQKLPIDRVDLRGSAEANLTFIRRMASQRTDMQAKLHGAMNAGGPVVADFDPVRDKLDPLEVSLRLDGTALVIDLNLRSFASEHDLSPAEGYNLLKCVALVGTKEAPLARIESDAQAPSLIDVIYRAAIEIAVDTLWRDLAQR